MEYLTIHSTIVEYPTIVQMPKAPFAPAALCIEFNVIVFVWFWTGTVILKYSSLMLSDILILCFASPFEQQKYSPQV